MAAAAQHNHVKIVQCCWELLWQTRLGSSVGGDGSAQTVAGTIPKDSSCRPMMMTAPKSATTR